MKSKSVLTKGAYQRLKNKLAALTKERKRLIEELEETRKMGDLAENSAYHELKNQLGILQSKIDEVERIVKSAQILEKGNKGNGTIGLGTRVRLAFNDKVKEFTIVSDGEADPMKGKISFGSPLSQALVGKKKGDKVKVKTPAGEMTYEILSLVN